MVKLLTKKIQYLLFLLLCIKAQATDDTDDESQTNYLLFIATTIKNEKNDSYYYHIKPICNLPNRNFVSEGDYIWSCEDLHKKVNYLLKNPTKSIKLEQKNPKDQQQNAVKKTTFSANIQYDDTYGKFITLTDTNQETNPIKLDILILPQKQEDKTFWINEEWQYFPYTPQQVKRFTYLKQTAKLFKELHKPNYPFLFFNNLSLLHFVSFDNENTNKIELSVNKLDKNNNLITYSQDKNEIKNIDKNKSSYIKTHDFFIINKENERIPHSSKHNDKNYYQVTQINPFLSVSFYGKETLGLALIKHMADLCSRRDKNNRNGIEIKLAEGEIVKPETYGPYEIKGTKQNAYILKCSLKKANGESTHIIAYPKDAPYYQVKCPEKALENPKEKKDISLLCHLGNLFHSYKQDVSNPFKTIKLAFYFREVIPKVYETIEVKKAKKANGIDLTKSIYKENEAMNYALIEGDEEIILNNFSLATLVPLVNGYTSNDSSSNDDSDNDIITSENDSNNIINNNNTIVSGNDSNNIINNNDDSKNNINNINSNNDNNQNDTIASENDSENNSSSNDDSDSDTSDDDSNENEKKNKNKNKFKQTRDDNNGENHTNNDTSTDSEENTNPILNPISITFLFIAGFIIPIPFVKGKLEEKKKTKKVAKKAPKLKEQQVEDQ